MTLPDVGPLGSLAGWFVAVFVMVGIVLMIIRGDLVPGATHNRALALIEQLTAKLGEQTPILREQGAVIARMAQSVEFMMGFVRDVIRDRTGRDHDA